MKVELLVLLVLEYIDLWWKFLNKKYNKITKAKELIIPHPKDVLN